MPLLLRWFVRSILDLLSLLAASRCNTGVAMKVGLRSLREANVYSCQVIVLIHLQSTGFPTSEKVEEE